MMENSTEESTLKGADSKDSQADESTPANSTLPSSTQANSTLADLTLSDISKFDASQAGTSTPVSSSWRADSKSAVSEWFRDAAKTRLFLATRLDQLHSREVAYQQSTSVTIGGVHADCMLLLAFDVECELLRAAYAAATLLTAAGADTADEDAERRRRRRQALDETRALWLEYCRTVTRLCYRIEAAFLRMACGFAGAVDGPCGCGPAVADSTASLARQLRLLSDAVADLLARIGLPTCPEFEACRDCLRRFIARQNEPPVNSAGWPIATRTGATDAWLPQQLPHLAPAAHRLSWTALLAGAGVVCALLAVGWHLLTAKIACWDWDCLTNDTDLFRAPY